IGGSPVTVEEMTVLEERYPLTVSVMLICKVGSTFDELLDDDEPTVLTDAVDDDNEEDDATMREMMVDDMEDADDQNFDLDDDDDAQRLRKFFSIPLL
ncbi:hypothetical protein HAX54_026660, partial [Datura stramonium]|nr:hypothetical protein [Datura stramonium]